MIFDQVRIHELKELGGDEFVTELWRAFLEICAAEIPKLEIALMTEKADQAGKIAHNLRSASGNVGACGLHIVCTKIEDGMRTPGANFSDFAAEMISTYEDTLASEPALKAA